jgi:hypothetical protein
MADTRNSAPSGASNTHTPSIPGTDSLRHEPILAAFARYQTGHAALAALEPHEQPEPGDDMTPGEKRAWDAIDAADTEIHGIAATTPAAVACKLWVALVHSTSDRDEEQAAVRANLEWFEDRGDLLDWNLRQIVSALRDLDTMAAGSIASADDPVSRYWEAFHAYEAGSVTTTVYQAAFTTMHEWTPQTPRDFVRKYEAAYSIGGCPTQENQDRLVEQAVAILGICAGKEG